MFFIGERDRGEIRLNSVCDSSGKQVADLHAKTINVFEKGNPKEYFQVHVGSDKRHHKAYWVKKEEIRDVLSEVPLEVKIDLITGQYFYGGSWRDKMPIESYIEIMELKERSAEDYKCFFEMRSKLSPEDRDIFDGIASFFPTSTWPKIVDQLKVEGPLRKSHLGVKILSDLLKNPDIKPALEASESRLIATLLKLEPEFLTRTSTVIGTLERFARVLNRFSEGSLETLSFIAPKLALRQLEDFIDRPYPKGFIDEFIHRVKDIEDPVELNACFAILAQDTSLSIGDILKMAEEFKGQTIPLEDVFSEVSKRRHRTS